MKAHPPYHIPLHRQPGLAKTGHWLVSRRQRIALGQLFCGHTYQLSLPQ